MVERATVLCISASFKQHVAEGDRVGQQWFDGGAHSNPNGDRNKSESAYRPLASLATDISLRGWSHYVLSYADGASARTEHDPHVQRIVPDQPGVWEQFQKWPGPMCGLHVTKHFPVSSAFGYVLDGKLVSVAQLEARPEELEWEYGVDTLAEYRGRGFAPAVLKTVTAYIIEQGRVPWHYTDHYNRPSCRLPSKLGYFQYGEGLFSAV
jgi:RimJ/RimL family protein N-acetyltransferase